jgi:1-phosphofructokinase
LAQPTIIKPNIHELAQLVGHELVGETAVIQAARQLLSRQTLPEVPNLREDGRGTHLVVVSMGEKGALFINQQQTIKAIPPTVQVKSTVGAGDAMVAGLVAGHMQNLPLADCARLATAFSLGGITRVGAHLPDADTLQSFINQVSIETLEAPAPTEVGL